MQERLCACNCGTPLTNLRADAIYASDGCRKRAQRRRAQPGSPERLWQQIGRVRRPNRRRAGAAA